MTQFGIDVWIICKHNKENNRSTHKERRTNLVLFGEQLFILGFGKRMRAVNLKNRHVDELIVLWKQEGISRDVIMNRLTYLRWLSRKIGKAGLIANSNDKYVGNYGF